MTARKIDVAWEHQHPESDRIVAGIAVDRWNLCPDCPLPLGWVGSGIDIGYEVEDAGKMNVGVVADEFAQHLNETKEMLWEAFCLSPDAENASSDDDDAEFAGWLLRHRDVLGERIVRGPDEPAPRTEQADFCAHCGTGLCYHRTADGDSAPWLLSNGKTICGECADRLFP